MERLVEEAEAKVATPLKVGEAAKTAAPLPVSSVKAPERLAEENEPKEVALPTEVTAPVRLALVVTVEALPLSAAVMVPAEKFPEPSRATIVEAVLALVASEVMVTPAEPL